MAETPNNRRAGRIYLHVGGQMLDAKGEFTCNDGAPERKTIKGADGVHGYADEPGEAKVSGAITDSLDLDIEALKALDDTTVTVELGSGKTFVLRNAWFSGKGDLKTGEGEIDIEFTGLAGEYIR